MRETWLKSVGKYVRNEARLCNPPHKYGQRAESINYVLKESTGGQFVD